MASYNVTLDLNSNSPIPVGYRFSLARQEGFPGLNLIAVPGVKINGVDGANIAVGDNAGGFCIKTNVDEWVAVFPSGVTLPTWQQIQNADPTGSFIMTNNGLTMRNTMNAYPIFSGYDYVKMQGYIYQKSLSGNLTISAVEAGSLLVSDDASSYTVTLTSSGLGNDYDLQIGFISGQNRSIVISVPSGITLNGVNGSVTPLVTIPAGKIFAQLIRLGQYVYKLVAQGFDGLYTPTFSNEGTGIGTFSNINTSFHTVNPLTGGRCVITSNFTAVVTAISSLFSITIPFGGNFGVSTKCQFMGGTAVDASQTLFTLFRGSGSYTNTIRQPITTPVGAIGAVTTFQVAFEYQIQP